MTPDPYKESLFDTEQVKEDSSFPNMEFQFSEDVFEFSDEEFKAPIAPSSSKLQVPPNSKKHINALIHFVTLRKKLFSLTQSNPRISLLKALITIRLMNTIR